MKKMMLLIFFAGVYMMAANAQSALPSVPDITKQAPLLNIDGTANAILAKLSPALSLTETQQPKILNLVTNFIKQKVNILPLQQSNPAAYTSKFGSLKNGLTSKLKTILTAAQFSNFLGLKPKTNDATNVLSQLFF